MIKYQKATLVFCLCGILLAFACNNTYKKNKETVATGNKPNEDQVAIRSLMEKYNDHFVKGEYEAMTAYVYPPVFSEFSKENMVKSMTRSMHHESMDITMKSIRIDSISGIFPGPGDSTRFALGTHSAKALYQFKPDVPEEDLRASCVNFTTAFGDQNVVCNIAEKNFMITMSDISFFIYSDAQKKWYTLGSSEPQTLKKYIPMDILRAMGLREDVIGK